MDFRDEIAHLMANSEGLIARQQHRELGPSLDYLLRRGELTTVLPGIYTVPALAVQTETRIRAAMLRHPDAVLTGATAAHVSYWPDAQVRAVEMAVATNPRPVPGFHFSRRRIPPELVVERGGLRFTDPALTAVDLATFACADAVDVALRTRTATLDGMYEATPPDVETEGKR